MRLWVAIPIVCVLTLADASRPAAEEPPDFSRGGQPFLDKHCIGCHSGDDAEAGLSLEGVGDAMTIVRQRKKWENLLKMVQTGAMPPEDQPQPSPDEMKAFVSHVEAVFDYAVRHAKPDPGRVTMRRLNRTEYRNTIRDLIGVDFDPTADFPSDDIGHGFDNIGDVLTLSPVLMERYLAAAESIVKQAIAPDPPAPPKRRLSARFTEPASGEVEKKVIENGWRRLASDGEEYIESGPINTPYEWQADGEYIFRTRVYAKSAAPVDVAVLAYGKDLPEDSSDAELSRLAGNVMRPAKILKTFTVQAATPEKAEVLEVDVPPMPGRHRMMLALWNPSDGKPPTELMVEYVALEGPLDTRPPSHRRLLACSADKPQAEQTREVLARFLQRAYRRPPTKEEIERLAGLVDGAVADGGKWEAGIQLAMQATLCSPKFLFRVELDDRPQSPETQLLDEYQLASRLSYFLWSTMPDDELFELAEKKQLTAHLDAQVNRMLADPKSQALVDNFALQWLQVQRLQWIAPDGTLFPTFDDDLRAAMLEETKLFFESVMREDRSIVHLIDADFTFLNEPLARHYGIADTKGTRVGEEPSVSGEPIRGEAFRRVSLQGRRRGGLLTQASVLTVTSNPTRTSPVKRGRWVLEQILGEPPPPPPPSVPELPDDEQAAAGGSLRERLEIHRKNPSCANCHAEMDAIGFGLENYDAIGAFRTQDGQFEVDASGEFADGTGFDGPEDLKQVIREKREQFGRCLAEKLMTYALGRGMEYYDRPTVERIVQKLAAEDYQFSVLVTEIVQSDPFRKRRGTAPGPDEGTVQR